MGKASLFPPCKGEPLTPQGFAPNPSKGALPLCKPLYRSPLGRREKPLSFPSSSDSVLGASRVKVKPLRGRLTANLDTTSRLARWISPVEPR